MYWIDQIAFGTPSIDQYAEMNRQTYLDSLFADFTKYGYPKNSSDATKEELNSLVEYCSTLEQYPQNKKRYLLYDRALLQYFKEGLSEDETALQHIKDIVDSISRDCMPLILKLKYHYNRPRPRQLASAYKLKLFPYKSYTADCPSFPSAHAILSKVLCEVLGNLYPSSFASMEKLHKDICYSRLNLGLCYQSDIDLGIYYGEEIVKHKEFALKYSI